mmetsp:Transcript_23319/g.78963  ORF Transcript_23319/g.78963 Transcript_23319/m.78963 type:complete len:243 (-) Transcript_23319:634-1362(-)
MFWCDARSVWPDGWGHGACLGGRPLATTSVAGAAAAAAGAAAAAAAAAAAHAPAGRRDHWRFRLGSAGPSGPAFHLEVVVRAEPGGLTRLFLAVRRADGCVLAVGAWHDRPQGNLFRVLREPDGPAQGDLFQAARDPRHPDVRRRGRAPGRAPDVGQSVSHQRCQTVLDEGHARGQSQRHSGVLRAVWRSHGLLRPARQQGHRLRQLRRTADGPEGVAECDAPGQAGPDHSGFAGLRQTNSG